jgi:hypothetical protein
MTPWFPIRSVSFKYIMHNFMNTHHGLKLWSWLWFHCEPLYCEKTRENAINVVVIPLRRPRKMFYIAATIAAACRNLKPCMI